MDEGTRVDAKAEVKAVRSNLRKLHLELMLVLTAGSILVLTAFLTVGRYGWWGFFAILVPVAGLMWRVRVIHSRTETLARKGLDAKLTIQGMGDTRIAFFHALDDSFTKYRKERFNWLMVVTHSSIFVLLFLFSGNWTSFLVIGGAALAVAMRLFVISNRMRQLRNQFRQEGLTPVGDQLHWGN